MPKFVYHDKLEIHIEMSLICNTGHFVYYKRLTSISHFHFVYYKRLPSM